jgi:ketosteroid isomerase-like protein
MRTFAAALCALAFAAPGFAQASKADDLQKPNKEFAAAVNAKDLARLGAAYTDDAVLMPPNGAEIKGRALIQAFWKEQIDQGMRVESMTSTGSQGFGTTGYESGVVELRFAPAFGSPVMDTVKFVTILQRGADGTWRIARDIWNSDLPR